MSNSPKLQPANARALGNYVRKTLKALNLPWKVKCKTVSFSGFGHGSAPFAEIETDRRLTVAEMTQLAQTLRDLRELPEDQGGGAGIIQLNGAAYACGGAIHHHDHPPVCNPS